MHCEAVCLFGCVFADLFQLLFVKLLEDLRLKPCPKNEVVFSQIAHRLGVWLFKTELEDLSKPYSIIVNSPRPIQNLAFSWGDFPGSRPNMRLLAVGQLHKIENDALEVNIASFCLCLHW
jgi:hypothetical protein